MNRVASARSWLLSGALAVLSGCDFLGGPVTSAPEAASSTATPSASSAPLASPTPVPSGGTACPAIALEGPPLLSPVPGATGVSTAVGTIVLGSPLPPAGTFFDLDRADGSLILRAALGPAPSPLPSPLPTAGAAGATAMTAALEIPALPAATAITVQEEPLAEGGCTFPASASGTFTTGN